MKKLHITAVVPAYNEQNTIGNVLNSLVYSKIIDKIIVVNDGSTDNTLGIAKMYNARIINLGCNMGKSQAVKCACSNLKTDIIFFCDADLINFKPSHIKKILEPVVEGKATMSIGLRNYRKFNSYIISMFPLLSGERAILYPVFKEIINSKYFYDYGMELVMNHYCKKYKLEVISRVLNYSHHLKPQKIKKNGLILLIKEIFQFFYIHFALKINNK